MKTLIVYDSFFGNTEQIARGIGNTLGTNEDVKVMRVSEVKTEHLNGLKLLIVGSPTRAFRPTKPIVDFLNKIPSNGLKNIRVLAFDTRISTVDANSKVLNIFVKLFGYAAKPIGDKLMKKGGELAVPPEGFFVKGSEGPLKDGELQRAGVWARQAIKA